LKIFSFQFVVRSSSVRPLPLSAGCYIAIGVDIQRSNSHI